MSWTLRMMHRILSSEEERKRSILDRKNKRSKVPRCESTSRIKEG